MSVLIWKKKNTPFFFLLFLLLCVWGLYINIYIYFFKIQCPISHSFRGMYTPYVCIHLMGGRE